jgi:thiol-disulfide isomerase/thioredoxin
VSDAGSGLPRVGFGSLGFRSHRIPLVAALALATTLLAAVTYRLADEGPDEAIHDALSEGRAIRAPELDLKVLTAGDLGGAPRSWWRVARVGRVTLGELRGSPVVVNFWSRRCEPCRQEAPVLQRVADDAGRGVLVLGVGYAGSPAQAREFVHSQGLSFPQAHDRSGDTTRRWGLEGVPETFFLSADGQIVAHVTGLATAAQLRRGVAAAVSGRPAGLQTGGGRDELEHSDGL